MAYPEKKIKANQCMFVLYPETQQEIIEYAQRNLPCAWALHDRDRWQKSDLDKWNRQHSDLPFPHQVGELKKPHVHFICKFPKSGRYFHAIASELGVSASTINRCSNLFRAFEYLVHRNDPDKFQYPPEIIGRNDFEVPTDGARASKEEEAQVKLLLEMPIFPTTYETARWAYENGCWSAFRRAYIIFRDIRNETYFPKDTPSKQITTKRGDL